MRLEVLNPSGPIEVTELYARRLADLNGKTICELSNDRWEHQRTFPLIRELLQKRFPKARIVPYTEFPFGTNKIAGGDIGNIVAERGCEAVIGGNSA